MRTEATTLPESGQPMNSSLYKTSSPVEDLVCLLQQISTHSKQLSVVTITFQFNAPEHLSTNYDLSYKISQSIHYFLEQLRPLVRKTDLIRQLGQTSYFILKGANPQGACIVQERLWESLLWTAHNIQDGEILLPLSIQAGHSTYPDPSPTFECCLQTSLTPSIHFTFHHEEISHKITSLPTPSLNYSLQESELPQLARQLGIPYLSLLPRKLPHRVSRLITPQLAQELRCYPLGRERDTLTVAMTDPQNHQAIDRLRQITGLRIFPVLTHLQELETALEFLC
jgi:hypothetical protein